MLVIGRDDFDRAAKHRTPCFFGRNTSGFHRAFACGVGHDSG